MNCRVKGVTVSNCLDSVRETAPRKTNSTENEIKISLFCQSFNSTQPYSIILNFIITWGDRANICFQKLNSK